MDATVVSLSKIIASILAAKTIYVRAKGCKNVGVLKQTIKDTKKKIAKIGVPISAELTKHLTNCWQSVT